jgi:hypothetical protein
MKTKMDYKRVASKIQGSEQASSPRSHATMPAGDKARKQNPQRLDIIRRAMLSSRKNDNA